MSAMKLKNLFIILAALSLSLSACQISAPQPNSGAAAEALNAAPTDAPQQEANSASTDSADSADNAANVEPTTAHPAEQLIASFVDPSQTNGEQLILYGQVLDVNGAPQPNSIVEIWQTDAGGVYDHPRDPSTGGRDTSFQFYGTTSTNADGWYAFRTIVPGKYEPRPRHIHYKVKQNGDTLLTSQFYFSDDIAEVQGERMFQAVGNSGDLLLIQLVQGEGQLLANGQIVIDSGIGGGTLPLTPSQTEGPYYPVVDLAAMDNDLVRLP